MRLNLILKQYCTHPGEFERPSEYPLLNVLVQTPKKHATFPIDKQNVSMNTFLD
ncbi:MAG: hypothetical protein ACTSV5_00470 [Promethearchaeota archaeon]